MKIFEPNQASQREKGGMREGHQRADHLQEIQKFARLEEDLQQEVATHKDMEGHVHLPTADNGAAAK